MRGETSVSILGNLLRSDECIQISDTVPGLKLRCPYLIIPNFTNKLYKHALLRTKIIQHWEWRDKINPTKNTINNNYLKNYSHRVTKTLIALEVNFKIVTREAAEPFVIGY